MFFNKQPKPVETFATQVSESADRALTSAQEAANEAIDSLADSVMEMRQHAAPMVNSVNRAADRVRGTARHASEATVSYIQHEPVKAILIAASTGAVLMALVSLMGRPRRYH